MAAVRGTTPRSSSRRASTAARARTPARLRRAPRTPSAGVTALAVSLRRGLARLDSSLGGAHTELLFRVDLPPPALGVDTNRALGRAIVDQVDRRRVTG